MKINRSYRRGRRLGARMWRLGKRVFAHLRSSEMPISSPSGANLWAKADVAEMVVLVTGSTRGVGRAIAEIFADAGASVIVHGRHADTVARAAREIGANRRGNVIGIAADIGDEDEVARLFGDARRRLGRIDVLINNAGVSSGAGKPAWQVSTADFEMSLRVNVTGPFLALRQAVEAWLTNGHGGRVINISSGAGEQAFAGLAPYGVSKFALEGLTQYAATDLARRGIAVASVKLGSLKTDMTRAFLPWEEYELLPDPSSVAPIFLELAGAPVDAINGRSFAAPRLLADFAAETLVSGPISTYPSITYPTLEQGGVTVTRDYRRFTLLDRAENQIGASPMVREALAQSLEQRPVSYYPDENYSRLRKALSAELDLPPEAFAFGNGSWVLLDEIVRIFAGRGDEVVSNLPGWFGFHALCPKYGIVNRRVPTILTPLANEPAHNLDGILAAIGPKTRLVYLVSPSNPEGLLLNEDDFARFMAEVPPNLPVLVDEAYVEFADAPDCVRTPVWSQRKDRVVIGLRTFSKFYGLAGLRVGYSYARPDIARLLRKQSFIFSVSNLAEEAALAALSDTGHRKRVFEATRNERRRVADAVARLGLTAIESHAPFMMIEAPCPLPTYKERFSKEGMFVPFYEFYDGNFVMFPIGSREQNARTLEILRSLV